MSFGTNGTPNLASGAAHCETVFSQTPDIVVRSDGNQCDMPDLDLAEFIRLAQRGTHERRDQR